MNAQITPNSQVKRYSRILPVSSLSTRFRNNPNCLRSQHNLSASCVVGAPFTICRMIYTICLHERCVPFSAVSVQPVKSFLHFLHRQYTSGSLSMSSVRRILWTAQASGVAEHRGQCSPKRDSTLH